MSIFIFIATLIIAYFVIKIGAAAFELTGLDPEQANFQALSTFTRTGFTTKEAELIVTHKQRRKIASALMILGNAGFVTLIATLANSIRPDPTATVMFMPNLNKFLPEYIIPYVNIVIVLIVLYLVYRLFRSSRFLKFLMKKAQQQMINKKIIQPVSFEELLLGTKGYGISQIKITEDNPLLGKKLSESRLREHDILVLSIERGEKHILNPHANEKLKDGDNLACFGKLENIRDIAYEEDEKKQISQEKENI